MRKGQKQVVIYFADVTVAVVSLLYNILCLAGDETPGGLVEQLF